MEGTDVASLAWNKWIFKRLDFIGDSVCVRSFLITRHESSRPGMGIIIELFDLMSQLGEVVKHGMHLTTIRKRTHVG